MGTIIYEGGGDLERVENVSLSYHDETDSWKFARGEELVLIPREHVVTVRLGSDEIFSITE